MSAASTDSNGLHRLRNVAKKTAIIKGRYYSSEQCGEDFSVYYVGRDIDVTKGLKRITEKQHGSANHP